MKAQWKKHEHEKGAYLEATFTFDDFNAAWGFMSRVALLAETHQHHPNWSNVYNTVTIQLSTHDAGNQVTEKDEQLASAIDQLL